MKKRYEFRKIVDRETTNREMSSNGGDYEEGRIIALLSGKPVAVRYWTSWDGDFCPLCGDYSEHTPDIHCTAGNADFRGWETSEVVTDKITLEVCNLRINDESQFLFGPKPISSIKSPAKAASSAANGRLGGRPKKVSHE